MGGRPLKFESVEALEEMIESYFVDCDQSKKPYTVSGLAVWLDTSRQTLINYEDKEEYFDTIKRAKARCEAWVEENALMSKTNATFSIFNLKNNFGWKDKTEQDVTSNGESIVLMPQEVIDRVNGTTPEAK
ncbi:terminase small subunit [Paracoccaceae bacterium GXU_MW_L88]